MPVRYEIRGPLIALLLEGVYAPDDILTTFLAALNDPSRPANPLLMLDVTRSTVFQRRSARDLARVGRSFRSHAHHVGHRCAMLTGSLIQYGVMRMAVALASSPEIEYAIFRDRDDALRWLTTGTE